VSIFAISWTIHRFFIVFGDFLGLFSAVGRFGVTVLASLPAWIRRSVPFAAGREGRLFPRAAHFWIVFRPKVV
jgi:hypothetical protein